jgi:PAS domain S-box-containing protein
MTGSLFRAMSVKAKLLIAFSVILALNFAVGAIGWLGFTNTENELALLQRRSLPDIDYALTLAHRSSALAALAPFIVSVQVINQLDAESGKLFKELDAFRLIVDGRSPRDDAARQTLDPELVGLAKQLDRNLRDLAVNARATLSTRSDALELGYEFNRNQDIEQRLWKEYKRRKNVRLLELANGFQASVQTLYGAMTAATPFQLEALERKYYAETQEALELIHELHGQELSPDAALQVSDFLKSQRNIFELRRRELGLQQRTGYLLETIHAVSTRLNDHVSNIVGEVTRKAQSRSRETTSALATGKAGILLLGAASILTVVIAALYVLRDLAGNLRAVTNAMTSLARGDRSVDVPAVGRADELGSLARAFKIFKDHGVEREELARQLAENSRMLEAMFANMTDGLSVFDKDNRLAAWNPRFLALNGLEGDDIQDGTSLADIVARQERARVEARTLDGNPVLPTALIAGRHHVAVQYELHFPDGRVVELRSQPMPSGGFVTSYTDLTERRATEKQLRQAQRMEAVGQLTGGIAHDFNNLLAAVSANLQMVQSGLYGDDKISRRLLRAMEAVERGSAVTQRLLAFSRQQALRPEVTNVNALVESLLDLVTYSLGDGIEVRTGLTDVPVCAMIDPGQLEDAILNLVFNSRDAMPDGGTLRVTTRVSNLGCEVGQRRIVIQVGDTGVGMPPETIVRVYEPFFTTKGGRGTGLGLSMVYGFVQQSGGEISIVSEVGIGTTVSLFLPAVDAPIPGGATIPQGVAELRGEQERILVVEDDALVRATIVDMLNDLGYVVDSAATAMEARGKLERSEFDLLLTDIMLPDGETGLDMAEYAKQSTPEINTVFMSGYAIESIKSKLFMIRGARFIEKPFKKDEVAAVLRSLLGRC